MNVFDRDAVAGGLFSVDVNLQIPLAHDGGGNHVTRAVDRFQGRFDRLADLVDRVQVFAEHLHADVGAHARGKHFDAIDDRLREDVAPAGHLENPPHFVIDKVALRAGLPGPEEDGVGKFFVQVRTQCVKRLESYFVEVLAKLRFDDFLRKSLCRGCVLCTLHQTRLAGRFDQLLHCVPVERR